MDYLEDKQTCNGGSVVTHCPLTPVQATSVRRNGNERHNLVADHQCIRGWSSQIEYLSGLTGTRRGANLLGRIESLGFPPLRPPVAVSERVSSLACPVLHLGERVGSIYLAEKAHGREFTREDEETLTLFASQAAMAIADLETLIDTSPVGVVVVDAATGAPKPFNREAHRRRSNA